MKTEVFLREEKKSKEIEIIDTSKLEIGKKFFNRWQNIINIVTDVIDASAGLMMKINQETREVFLKSKNKDNPYKTGGSESLGQGLYCETVIAKEKEL